MKNKICGIYKFLNPITNKVYIGQSIDIRSRYQAHKSNHLNPNYINYNAYFYKALRKYGFENFNFEIIEECESSLLDEREKYWINYYNSYNNGYNMTKGGDFNPSKVPEIVQKRTEKLLNDSNINKKLASYGNSKLTKDDIIKIRTAYKEGKTFSDTYNLFKDKISYSGFQQCWRGKTWTDIMPEVYEERKIENTGGSKLNSNIIKQVRLDYMNGVSKDKISKKYNINKPNLNRILRLDRWNKKEAIPDGYINFISK